MTKAKQQRTLETRARLVAAAQAVIEDVGYEGLRVDQVVKGAGVAKGTFFAHFRDKDALMDQLIGARIDAHLDQLEALPEPQTVVEIVEALLPMMRYMTCERYVFDVILRYSGAAAVAEIGPIANTFGRHAQVIEPWFVHGNFRTDIKPDLISEGVMAFAIQAMSLMFCALHNETDLRARLTLYLDAWLQPRTVS
ncbi:TetR/AcrR family transcriptional regulator [Shimia abyssi]|uniref:TetR family transcriptional regulator n=1 Tax=Shimia abyssi TaxID=1662395 RepID=A0A2P8FI16_9RHOB|nr:TetR/AcrR family transcriptional regulator [Shimia abyssi]PSL21358.1 TetR family transcriptional regulator [Shimia abyssi]